MGRRVGRLARDEIAQRRDRRIEVAPLQLRHPEVEAGDAVGGIGVEQLVEHRVGLLAAAALHQGQPQAVPGVGKRGVDGKGVAKGGNRPVEITPGLQRDPKVETGQRQRRIQGDRAAQGRDGGLELSLVAQDEAEVVVRLGMSRIEGDRPSQRIKGARALLRPPERRPEVILRVEELRIDLGRTREGGDGLVDAVELAQHESAAVEPRRAVGRQARRPLVVRERVGHAAFALGKASCHEVDAGRVGRPGEQALDLGAGGREFAFRDEPLGPGNRRADRTRRRHLRVHPVAARGEHRDAHPDGAAAPARQPRVGT